MEKNEEKILDRKRFGKWAKLFFLFLAFMWLCTIISKSIYVASLPIVKTDTASKKYVEHVVEAEGIVVSGGEIAVNTQAGLRVDKINVSVGDEVKEGDIIFTVDMADISDIIRTKEMALSKLQYSLSDIQANSVIDAQKREVAALWAQEDYDTADSETAILKERAKAALDKAQGELERHIAGIVPYTPDDERGQAWDSYRGWVKRGYDISDMITEKEREIKDLEEQLAELDITKETDEDKEKRAQLQDKIKKAYEELRALQDELTRHGRDEVLKPDYTDEEAEYDAWQERRLALEAEVQKAIENYSDASYSREVTLRQKMREIANAQVTARADSAAAAYELDIGQIRAELENFYSLQRQKGEIRAQDSGIVSNIQISVGGRTPDTAAILLTDAQKPCRFKFSVTKGQAKYIHLDDTVELMLDGQPAIEARAGYFEENQQGGYDIMCVLPQGVGRPGLGGNARKSVQGEYHSLVLPVDAVHGETNSFYIYAMNEREGILGSEYYAEKIRVQVKDGNERYVAVEPGTISGETRVITYSTKELKQGAGVRPQET